MLVSAAARAMQAMLPELTIPAGPALGLRALGGDRAGLDVGGHHIVLSRRHSEITVLLALHPEGLTAEQLALELFGEDGRPVSVRAELSRMRRLVGPALDAPPYHFTAPVEADVLDVRRALDAGRAGEALAAYSGELLPCSEAPGIVDDALLRVWLGSSAGARDLPALELLLRRHPMDPALAMLGRRAARLRAE